MPLARFECRHVHNPSADPRRPFGEDERKILSRAAFEDAEREITSWPGYAPTPLIPLPGLAARLALGLALYKDEGRRFGLASFKALGGAYAVLRLLQQHVREEHGLEVASQDLLDGRMQHFVRDVTVTTATDGNHGRSVAWAAQIFGCRSIIYIHEEVSSGRAQAIAQYGAELRRVPGSYDDAVRRCAHEARTNGWLLVADTSAEGGARVPALVMQGYTLVADELLSQRPAGSRLTHVFVQAGVGGLAAAVSGHFWERLGAERPRIVVVEPARADCVFRSIAAGAPTPVPGDVNTFMACLAAGEISPAAWTILKTAADDVITLPDRAAAETMRLLADGVDGDPPIVSGESGCAATAGLIAAALDPTLRDALDLGPNSCIAVIGSEGATDPETYERVVGRSVHAIAGGRSQ